MEICSEPPSPASTTINIFSLSFPLCPQPHIISFYSFLYWSILKHILQFYRSHSSLQYLVSTHSLLQYLPQASCRAATVPLRNQVGALALKQQGKESVASSARSYKEPDRSNGARQSPVMRPNQGPSPSSAQERGPVTAELTRETLS